MRLVTTTGGSPLRTDVSVNTARGIARLPNDPDRHLTLRAAAQAFEAAVLAEMLRAAGAGRPVESFGGGVGEQQFASFLVDEQATRMAERGGIGVAEMILRQLLAEQGSQAQP